MLKLILDTISKVFGFFGKREENKVSDFDREAKNYAEQIIFLHERYRDALKQIHPATKGVYKDFFEGMDKEFLRLKEGFFKNN